MHLLAIATTTIQNYLKNAPPLIVGCIFFLGYA